MNRRIATIIISSMALAALLGVGVSIARGPDNGIRGSQVRAQESTGASAGMSDIPANAAVTNQKSTAGDSYSLKAEDSPDVQSRAIGANQNGNHSSVFQRSSMYVEPTAEEVELLDLTFGGFDGNQNGHRSSVLQSRSMYVEPTAEETEQ